MSLSPLLSKAFRHVLALTRDKGLLAYAQNPPLTCNLSSSGTLLPSCFSRTGGSVTLLKTLWKVILKISYFWQKRRTVPQRPPWSGAAGTIARAGKGGMLSKWAKLCGCSDWRLALYLDVVVHIECRSLPGACGCCWNTDKWPVQFDRFAGYIWAPLLNVPIVVAAPTTPFCSKASRVLACLRSDLSGGKLTLEMFWVESGSLS